MKQTLRLLLCLGLVLGLTWSKAEAQGAAQSKDYWVSFFPSIDNTAPIWLLAATNVEGTQVKITYLEDGSVDQFMISPNKPKEYRIKIDILADDKHQMAKPNAWEVKQKRSVHVEASHPISLQGFTDADNNVGLFLILPTSNLGQKYTISAYNDQHSRMSDGGGGFGGWEPAAFPPTGGGFIVVATEDNTQVTMHVTGPTSGGRRQGEQWGINMNKGETYYVRGAAESEDDDLSRSTVMSSKPVAVFAGCEIARTYDAMVLQNHFDYNDYIVEQMIPQEIWGKEYVSGPFTNKRGTKEDDLWGDYYRVYAAEPTELFMDGQSRGSSDYWEFSLQTVPRIFTADKPIQVVQYDYYIDFHGINPKNPRTSNSEMVLVPRHNWRRNATFTVPKGYAQTYFHVVAHRDSIDKITAILPGRSQASPISGMKFSGAQTYNIGPYRIYTLVLGVIGQVRVQGPCDFAVYNYGTRDNDYIKATYSYASAAAASFGSLTNAKPPRMVMDSTCTEFNLKFYNTDVDARGMGDMYLLHDPEGLVYRGIKYDSKNVTLDVTEYGFGADTVFANVKVIDELQDAFAALYVTNRAGKDTVYTFTYKAPSVTAQPTIQKMENVNVFAQECKVFTFKNTGQSDITIEGAKFMRQPNTPTPFTASFAVQLPHTLKPGTSVDITACFTAPDTGIVHWDSLQVVTACFAAEMARVEGFGRVPTIFAQDHDYKVVDVGQTSCAPIEIANLSPYKELVLTTDILKANDEFKISDADLARFPITLAKYPLPGHKTNIEICYTPIDEGRDSAFIVWGRDIPVPYSDSNRKEWTILIGSAQKPGISISSANDQVICVDTKVLTALLRNTGSGDAIIQPLAIGGVDATEFSIQSVESMSPNSWTQSFPLGINEEKDVNILFTPDMAQPNPWRIHTATMIVMQGAEQDTATFTIDMRSPIVAAEPLVDMGTIGEGESSTGTVTVTNTGNYEFKVKSIGFQTGGVFTIVSGLAVGDIIPPNESRTVNLSATSNVAGTYTDELLVEGERCRDTKTALAMLVKRYEVTAAGADIPATWTCREDNNYDVTFTNNSSDPVKLKYVELLGAGAVNASQITFGTPDVGTVIGNGSAIGFPGGERVVAANEVVRIPVNFASSIVGNASVTVQFTYDDKDGIPQTLERQITAIGKNYPVDLTVSGAAYRGTNDVQLEVPIVLNQTDLFDAEVYGYEFDLTFNEDNFTVADVQQGNGHLTPTFAEVGKTNVGGVDYTTIRVTATGSRLENNENILARVILLTRLTTENTTTIVPSNFKFLDQNGQAACWTPKTELGNEYTYDPLCGDKSLQQYLANGISFLQNNSIAPNPAKSASVYAFDLQASNVLVSVGVYDALGNQVATVLNEKTLNAGHHELNIDVTTLPAGTYYVRTNAGEGWVATQKLTVQK